jgi:hypothetical protein
MLRIRMENAERQTPNTERRMETAAGAMGIYQQSTPKVFGAVRW